MPEYKPHARVAHQTSRRIDEVDGAHTTHTELDWHTDWMVTDDADHRPPPPVAANKGAPAWIAVPAMIVSVLMATAAALLNVTADHPDQTRIVLISFGALGIFCVLLAIPAAFVAISNRIQRTGMDR